MIFTRNDDDNAWNRMAELLAYMAVYDMREGGPMDIKAWLAVAVTQGWDDAVVERIITDHYAEGASRPRLTPAMVSDEHRRLRSKAAEGFVPPRLESDDDPDAPVRADAYRAALRQHVERKLAHYAATGEEPTALEAPVQAVTSVAQLAAAAPPHLRDEVRHAARRLGR